MAELLKEFSELAAMKLGSMGEMVVFFLQGVTMLLIELLFLATLLQFIVGVTSEDFLEFVCLTADFFSSSFIDFSDFGFSNGLKKGFLMVLLTNVQTNLKMPFDVLKNKENKLKGEYF